MFETVAAWPWLYRNNRQLSYNAKRSATNDAVMSGCLLR